MTKIIILCIKVILFGSNGPKTNKKQLNCFFFGQGGLKLLFSGQKLHFWAQKNQVLKLFQPSLPLFLTKFPPNCPYILLVHVLGCQWYLLGCSRSENMPFLTILLNPICQSRPKLGQNSQNHYYLCKSDFFCSNEANSNRKQLYWVSIGYWCKNCPFLVKCSISGLWNSRF